MIELALIAAAATFHPPVDTPLRYVTTETRVLDGQRFAFRMTRHLSFHQEPQGYLATLELDAINGDAGNAVGAIVQKAMAGFVGRPIRLHLDASGKIVSIDDLPALWATLKTTLAALGDTPARKARAARFAAALDAVPTAGQQAMIGSFLDTALAGDDAALHPGDSAPIDVTADAPGGAPATLHGRRTVSAAPGDRLSLHVAASGTVPAGKDSGQSTLERDTLVDPAAGLVLPRHEATSTAIGTARSSTETTIDLDPPVS
ncbi:MAG: hypothetical protein ACTHMG_01355 [Sphingomonas sp.]